MDDIQKSLLNVRDNADRLARITELLSAYQDAQTNIQAEIAKIYAQYAIDGILKPSAAQRINILRSLQQQLQEQAQNLGNIENKHLSTVLTDVYGDTYYRSVYTLGAGLGITINFSLLNPNFVRTAVFAPINGKDFSSRIWDNKDNLVNYVRAAVKKTMIEGADIKRMFGVVAKEFDVSRYEAKRLLTTELAKVATSAQEQTYKDSGVVDEVIWSSTLDAKTSEICRERDGKVYPLDNHPSCPVHPSCRSAILPYFGKNPQTRIENIKQNGTKPIIPYTNYEDWAKANGIQ